MITPTPLAMISADVRKRIRRDCNDDDKPGHIMRTEAFFAVADGWIIVYTGVSPAGSTVTEQCLAHYIPAANGVFCKTEIIIGKVP